MNIRCLLVLGLVVVGGARGAVAADDSEGDLVKQGVTLREQGRDVEALDAFRKAWEKHKTPRARAQMGLAEQALGRWVDAESHLEEALGMTGDNWIVNNRSTLENALVLIRQRLGSLDVLCEVKAAEVLVDGQSRGKLPLPRPLRVVAGTVLVQVQAPGYLPVQRHIAITAGQLARESFYLAPVAQAAAREESRATPAAFVSASPDPAADQPRKGGLPKGVFIGAAAATVVAGGLAIWSGLDVLKANDEYEKMPTRALYDDGRSRERRTNLILGGTALLGVTTAVIGLLATDWSR